MNPNDFAIKIKEKYPEYANVDNYTLAQKVVEKYPVYQSQVNFNTQTPAQKGNVFGSAVKKVNEKATQTYGKGSLLNTLTAPAKAVSKIGAGALDFLSSGTQKFGATAGEALAAPKNTKLYDEAIQRHTQTANELRTAINKRKGQDTAKLEEALRKHELNKPLLESFVGQDTARRMNETLGQNIQEVGGQALMTGVEALTGNLASKGVKSFKAIKEAPKVFPTATKQFSSMVKQALPYGYSADVSLGLTGDRGENREGAKALIPGLGSVASVALPAVMSYAPTIAKGFSKMRANKQFKKAVTELQNIESNYAKTRKAEQFAKDGFQKTRERIVKSGVLNEAIDAEGKIITKRPGGVIDLYKQNTIGGMEDVVKKGLIKEGNSVNTDIIKAQMRRNISQSNLTAKAKEKALNDIDSTVNSLNKLYGEKGKIPLHILQDEKIKTTSLIDFNTPATTKAESKALAKAYKEIIENNSKLNVKEVNSELAKYYQDIEYLGRLDGLRVKGGRLGKYFASVAGNVIGGGLGSVGGGVGAGVGALLGGELAAKAQSMLMKSRLKSGKMGFPTSKILEKATKEANTPAVIKQLESGYSNNRGNLNTIYNTTKIPTNNSIPKVSQELPKKSMTDKLFVDEYSASGVAKDIANKIEQTPNKQGGFIGLPKAKTDDISKSIQKAKASGQSFDEWAKAQNDPLLEFKTLKTIKDPDIARGSVKEAINDIGGINNVRRGEAPIGKLETTENINTLSTRYKVVEAEVKNGTITPIITDEYLRVLDGHHRLEVYKAMGMKEIPVIVPKQTPGVKFKTRSQLKAEWNKVK